MKRTSITALLAGALLGAGCSRPAETTAATPGPTPEPTITAEQLTAIKNSAEADKEAEQQKRESTQTDVATAIIPAEPAMAAEAQDASPKPTP